ncbi:17592_t:CDS:1, partial [Cetraspora pellucida]
MNNPTGIYHYGETLCNDPDKDFEILDYVSIGDNSESLEQPTSSLLSKYSTSCTENDINLYDSSHDIQFNTSAIGLAKAYANSSSTTMQERDNEIDINWLAQDLDVTSNSESSWDTTICHENELTLEFNSGGVKQLNETCIIVDDLNGTLQRCPHPAEKPLKQLGGIWELDFDMVDEIVMKSKGDGLNTLGVCKSHFNYDNKQLHECQKTEVSIDKAVIHRKRCLFCGHY